MEIQTVKRTVSAVYEEVVEQRDYLIRLDQQNGDGDLGLSMCGGFRVLCEVFDAMEKTDFGRVFLMASKTSNEAVPSSFGAILSSGIIGMTEKLKGKTEVPQEGMAEAMQAGVDSVMEKVGSKVGEKTTLDTLVPAIEELRRCGGEMVAGDVWVVAAVTAEQGSESTR